MEQSRQFKHLLNAIKEYTDDIWFPDQNHQCFATGTIKGYKFRLFQDWNINGANGTNDKYSAFLCIKDERAVGSKWPAFYDKVDIDEWIENKEKYKDNE